MDSLDMTRLRLAGKVSDVYSVADEEEPTEQEGSELLDAITALVESIKNIPAATVDIEPMLKGVQEICDRMTKKREWRFHMVRNDDGDVVDIIAKEV